MYPSVLDCLIINCFVMLYWPNIREKTTIWGQRVSWISTKRQPQLQSFNTQNWSSMHLKGLLKYTGFLAFTVNLRLIFQAFQSTKRKRCHLLNSRASVHWFQCKSPSWAPQQALPPGSSPQACLRSHCWSTPPHSRCVPWLAGVPPGRLYVIILVTVTTVCQSRSQHA